MNDIEKVNTLFADVPYSNLQHHKSNFVEQLDRFSMQRKVSFELIEDPTQWAVLVTDPLDYRDVSDFEVRELIVPPQRALTVDQQTFYNRNNKITNHIVKVGLQCYLSFEDDVDVRVSESTIKADFEEVAATDKLLLMSDVQPIEFEATLFYFNGAGKLRKPRCTKKDLETSFTNYFSELMQLLSEQPSHQPS